jgi:glycosyltransferase involved in cell wall biosynthesis
MSDHRPISVLIPTRNCAALVPGHIESLRSWLDLAEEIVVVDSNSKDGTVDLLRAGISHPGVRFLTHPPGLYESWNFGIQNAVAKYIYIATVGDSITRDGVEQLFRAAEQFQSDVVISKPSFISGSGEPLPDDRWPVDVVIERLKIDRPRLLTTTEQFLFAVTNTWGAILGSSASNLYRADCLKARSFPTEFGTAGDGGWGIQNIFDVGIAVVPGRFSNFRRHEKSYSMAEYPMDALNMRLFRLAQSVIASQRATNPAVTPILDQVRWPELEKALETILLEQIKLEELRGKSVPWFLNPSAWAVRSTRERAERKVDSIVTAVVAGTVQANA